MGTTPPTCPEPGQGPAQIYLEFLGHRVRWQRPGGRHWKADHISLLRRQEEQTGRVGRRKQTDVDRKRLVFRQGSRAPEAVGRSLSCMRDVLEGTCRLTPYTPS